VTFALHPDGAVRAELGGVATDSDVFRRLGVGARNCDLGDRGLYLAEEIVRADTWLGAHEREALGVLILAVAVATRQGATRVPLDPKGPLRDLVRSIAGTAKLAVREAALLRTIHSLTDRGHFAATLGHPGQRSPLIIDDGCLYTERGHRLEVRVADALSRRFATTVPGPSAAEAGAIAGAVATGGGLALTTAQRAAVRAAIVHPISVISGGPGTGKTAITVAIVRALARAGCKAIALAAPTGKAAANLEQIVGAQLATAGADHHAPPAEPAGSPPPLASLDPVDAALAESLRDSQTLHRLLGWHPDGFRHHAGAPLAVDAVIVDEASMVDLALFDALLDALPASARLVLIGDARQLPSVEAGQVLAELIDMARDAPWATTLHDSFRMDPSDPAGRAILEAARAIDAGEIERVAGKSPGLAVALTRADRLSFHGVEVLDTGGQLAPALDAATRLWLRTVDDPDYLARCDHEYAYDGGHFAPDDAEELDALLDHLERRRVLTATRGQDTGAVAISRHLHDRMLSRGRTTLRPDFVPGEPILMTANDPDRGLFNGDHGVIARVRDRRGAQHYRAVFRRGFDLIPFPLEAVRSQIELAWAITVHKSQGSELDEVVLLAPREDVPLVTRELLYTGMTRARRAVALVGPSRVLIQGGRRSAARHSGLASRIRS
jgi:exodeoxyribonuclease V alpha subunit